MPITTAEEFLSILERSNLLPPEELAEVREFSRNYPSAAQLAKALVSNEVITPWQKGHLLQGRASFMLGKYRLITLLGRGGMGGVFLASHIVMHRYVALKSIPARIARNPAALARFLTEARTIALLDHPNIVRAYSVDNEGDRYYLVMEYVDGMDLQRAVEAYGPLDIAASVDYIRQAADGLAHAHKRNMIHCDIKPSNLIVTELDGTVKILDMGLARLVQNKPGTDESDSSANHILGSVDYLAPEQAMASPDFNHRADIYALGCTLYFLLTGQPPFPTGTLAQRIVKHQTLEPEDITRLRPEVPANLVAICKKMMAKDPAERYQTAAEVRDVLAAWQPEVPQPAKKTIAIKKIEPIEDFSTVSPWEQEFGEELKNLANSSGAHEFGMLPGKTGKMPVAKKNGSSSSSLKKMLAGTRQRLILTTCTIAFFLVCVAAVIIISIVYSDKTNQANDDTRNNSQKRATPDGSSPPPPPPVSPSSETLSPNDKNQQTPPAPPSPSETPSETPATNPSTPKNEEPKTEEPKNDKPAESAPAPEQKDNTPEAVPTAPVENPAKESENPPKANPLIDVVSAIDLPPLGNNPMPPGVPLGKVHLEANTKLQVELLGGEKAGRGVFAYVLKEDANAAGGQAWNINRESRSKPATPIARLRLKGEDLAFSWLDGVSAGYGNPLRMCGVTLTAGDANRFVQFRLPKNADPIQLDLDKGATNITLRTDNLPELERLKLIVLPLSEAFPGPVITESLAPPRKMVKITFNNPNLAPLAIHILYDTTKKGEAINIEASYYLGAKPFRSSMAENLLKDLKLKLNAKAQLLNNAKNNPNLAPNLKQLHDAAKIDLDQATESIGLAKKLNTQIIHYLIIVEYEKHQMVFFDSRLAPPKEP